MAKIWTFKDYVNDDGQNVVRGWLDALTDVKAKTHIHAAIRYLEAVERFSDKKVKALEGDCDGLMELRLAHRRIQYRPLCCYGPGRRDVTILFMAIEQNDRFKPLTACQTALSRKARIHEGGRVCDHDFG